MIALDPPCLSPAVTITGISGHDAGLPGHDAGIAGHDRPEYPRALRKEANDYDTPDEFTLETPMFEELSAQLRKVRDAEGAFALHCMVDRSKYKIYEYDVANNFAITVHCNAYGNLNWMDDQYSDEIHPAVLKGTPTAAALGFDNDFVVGGHHATWAAAAPIRNSQGKIVAIVEAHLPAPELCDQLQWNASSPACGR